MDDKVLLVQANIKIHELERNKATEVMQLQDKIADLELRLSQARAVDNAQADNATLEQVSQCVFIVRVCIFVYKCANRYYSELFVKA